MRNEMGMFVTDRPANVLDDTRYLAFRLWDIAASSQCPVTFGLLLEAAAENLHNIFVTLHQLSDSKVKLTEKEIANIKTEATRVFKEYWQKEKRGVA